MNERSIFSPIALFVYARLKHTKFTVEAILKNKEARETDLIIFSDAPRSLEKKHAVNEVRDYIRQIKGFRTITVCHRQQNFGLAKSIIEGVSQILTRYDRVIVLEDDMVTSPFFLAYMNDALNKFADDERIICIHGYTLPIKQPLPEAFFLPGAECWGWATWSRGWKLFNPNGRELLKELQRKQLLKSFDFNGNYPYSKMLKDQINGKNDSWAIRWYASAFLAEKLTLHPGRSLVQNIGNDDSGTHCGISNIYNVELSSTPINLQQIQVAPSVYVRTIIGNFFKHTRESSYIKVMRKIKKLIFRFIL